jgi:hypothetical protein
MSPICTQILFPWNNPFLIPNAEANTTIYSCWKTITDLRVEKRKYCGTTTLLYIVTHILKLGMYFTITLQVNGQPPNNIWTPSFIVLHDINGPRGED